MSRRALLPLLPLAILVASATACATSVTDDGTVAADSASTRRVSEPIVAGTPSPTSDNAIVYIAVNGNSGEFCTGTLIAPNLVITARHCVSELDETVECGDYTTQMAPSTLGISVGVSPGTISHHATKIFVDTARGNNSCGNDMAMFQLDQDVAGAMIAKVRFTKLTVGEAARTAGYGDDGSGTPTATRFQKTGIAIDAVGPTTYTYKDRSGKSYPVSPAAGEIVTGESTCFGDSGGPLFDGNGNLIGMTSRGIDDKCIDRPSIYSDTASHEQFIKATAVAAGHPLAEATVPAATPAATATPASASSDPSSDDPSSDDTTDDPPAKKKTTTRAALAAPSSGCSTSPSPGSPVSSLVLVGLALAALKRRRR